ncbi:hypothetical protein GJ744_012437 [Endocarpon pusillum]|uniref:Uncharacterized protein n=1 Tax=Endocarpon pusillum TaxID=364733 RepID=A0A8H7E1G2_9EURO|nr:hypothetical protein GJ744_012437 [Endocarpon pusillum]
MKVRSLRYRQGLQKDAPTDFCITWYARVDEAMTLSGFLMPVGMVGWVALFSAQMIPGGSAILSTGVHGRCKSTSFLDVSFDSVC